MSTGETLNSNPEYTPEEKEQREAQAAWDKLAEEAMANPPHIHIEAHSEPTPPTPEPMNEHN